MRLKKWMLLVGYMCLFLGFGYSCYSIFVDETGSNFWIMWGIASLVMGYQVINFLVKKKNDNWNDSYVVADQRVFRKILVSLSISYVFILIFLLIGTIGFYNDFISGYNILVGAVISSLLVFMISQIVQSFVN
ncbi:hypothetical protein QNH26_20620 [Peribacillus frigoritolerans]|uniref:hypothetical protein n=1 Tax=Peribacillus frigoritolerans TaxID=450367 RepID=UPI0024C20BF8|nr:hypothetical protein [Peribacillus frigoritolerans]WHX66047.1 hypothetical protein QNH26_20620 [Peribacillus frigoritolerans]